MDTKDLIEMIVDGLSDEDNIDKYATSKRDTMLEMDGRIGWMEPLNCPIERITVTDTDNKIHTILVFNDDVIVDVKAKNAPRQIPSR